jgi:hypothetical protein
MPHFSAISSITVSPRRLRWWRPADGGGLGLVDHHVVAVHQKVGHSWQLIGHRSAPTGKRKPPATRPTTPGRRPLAIFGGAILISRPEVGPVARNSVRLITNFTGCLVFWRAPAPAAQIDDHAAEPPPIPPAPARSWRRRTLGGGIERCVAVSAKLRPRCAARYNLMPSGSRTRARR